MIKTTTPEMLNLGLDSEDQLHYNNEASLEPRQHVIDALLRFSRSLEIKKSTMVGEIESISN